MTVFLSFFFFVFGIALLIYGADYMIEGAKNIAKRFHLPEVLIGLTLVAIGTSAPELLISFLSLFDGKPELANGNIIGSNIANMGLILGVSGLIGILTIPRSTKIHQMPIFIWLCLFLLFSTIIWTPGVISTTEGVLLLLAFAGYFSYLAWDGFKHRKSTLATFLDHIPHPHLHRHEPLWKDSLFTLGGLVALLIGGKLAVDGAVGIATFLFIPELLIGLFLTAIGTSLPELASAIIAVRKKATEMAIGNVLGSNIFNIFLFFGIGASIQEIPVSQGMLIPFSTMLAFAILMGIHALFFKKLWHMQSLLFLFLYISYTLVSFFYL